MPNEDPIERRAQSLAALIRRIWRSIAQSFTSSLTSAPSVSMEDTGQLRTEWVQQLGGVVLGHLRQTYMDGAGHIARATSTDLDDQIGADVVQVYLDEAENRLRGIGDDVWHVVRAQIRTGMNAGESVADIAQRVKNVANVSTQRALVIARTESHMAYEAGAHAQAEYVDPNGMKTWVATNDPRTRESHRVADGQTVKIGDAFEVGGTTLRFPGDPLGEAGETINCRCSTTYDFDAAPQVQDSPVVDEFQLVAAGKKWNPQSHPRDKNGRFIKKGNLADFFGLEEPDFLELNLALNELTPDKWDNVLTTQQKDHILDVIDTMPPNAEKLVAEKFVKKTELSIAQAKDDVATSGTQDTTAPITSLDKIWKKAQLADHDEVIATAVDDEGTEYSLVSITDWDGNQKIAVRSGDTTVAKLTDKSAVESWANTHNWHIAGESMPTSAQPSKSIKTAVSKPNPSDLKDTGIVLGSHGARVYTDLTGQKWLFKKQAKFATDLDLAAAELQKKAGRPFSETFAISIGGSDGSIQRMLTGKDAFPGHPSKFDSTKLGENDVSELLRENALDYLIGNYDAHSENYIKLPDGKIFGADKGNALKFFGQDALDKDWRPNEHRTVYSHLWRDYAAGKNVDITQKNIADLLDTITQLQMIPDEDIKKMFRPYAEGAHAKGYLATAPANSWAEPLKPRTVPKQNVEAFLDAIVERKKQLAMEFGHFYTKNKQLREAKLGIGKPAPLSPLTNKDEGQKAWGKGLITTDEFFAAHGEYPAGSEQALTKALPDDDEDDESLIGLDLSKTQEISEVYLPDYDVGDVIAKSANGDYLKVIGEEVVAYYDSNGEMKDSLVVTGSPLTLGAFASMTTNDPHADWTIIDPNESAVSESSLDLSSLKQMMANVNLNDYQSGDVIAESSHGDIIKVSQAGDYLLFTETGGTDGMPAVSNTGIANLMWKKSKENNSTWVVLNPSSSSSSSQSNDGALHTNLNDVNLNDYSVGNVVAVGKNGDYVKKSGTNAVTYHDASGNEIDSMSLGPYSLKLGGFVAMNSFNEDPWRLVTPGQLKPTKAVKAAKKVATPQAEVKVPEGLKGKPGDLAKVTTSVIWAKHPPNTVILEVMDGSERIRWDGKKYVHESFLTSTGEWLTNATLTKKDTYAQFKDDTYWHVPGGQVVSDPYDPMNAPPPEGDFGFTMPEPVGKKVAAKKAKFAQPAASSTFMTSGPPVMIEEDKKFLLGDLHDEEITVSESIALINSMDSEDVANILSKQNANLLKSLETATGNAKHPKNKEAITALMKYTDMKADVAWYDEGNAEQTSQFQQSILESTNGNNIPLTGEMMTQGHWLDITQNPDLKNGDLVAISSDGQNRVIFSEFSGLIVQGRTDDNDDWIALETYDITQESGDPADDPEVIIDNLLYEFGHKTWLTPTAGDIKKKNDEDNGVAAYEATPVPYSPLDVIGFWPGLISGKSHNPGDVVALSVDGKYQLIKGPNTANNMYAIHKATGPNKFELHEVLYGTDIESVIESHYPGVWVVPPPKKTDSAIPAPADLPEGDDIPTYTVLMSGLVHGKISDNVFATGKMGGFPSLNFRLSVTEENGTKKIKMEGGTTNVSSKTLWVDYGTYETVADFNAKWGGKTFTWKKATPLDKTSTMMEDVTPVADAPGPTAVPSATPPTVTDPYIPNITKKQWKAILKADGVGYWSKPEKLWDSIKKIQATYPGAVPGQSKYTPMQILKALDSTTNTQEPNPFETKITKWASTAKGSKYIDNHSGGGIMSDGTTPPVPSALGAKMSSDALAKHAWSFLTSTDDTTKGTILFTGTWTGAPGGKPLRIVSNTYLPGSPSAILQSKLPNGEWAYFNDISTQGTLAQVIKSHSLKPTASLNLTDGKPSGKTTGLNMGEGDISHVSDAAKKDIYADFKKQPATYLSSDSSTIFAALTSIASDHNLNLLQGLKIIDEVGAQKVNKPNEFLFEKKITAWLKTKQGVAVATGKPIPLPDTPGLKPGFSEANIPTFDASSKFTYKVISTTQALQLSQEQKAKYGDWTSSEQSGLKTYTGGTYYSINGYLRQDPGYATISPTNTSAMKRAQHGMRPSTVPLLLHRGVGFNGVANAKSSAQIEKMIGQTWKNPGFSSTSVGGKAAFSSHPVIIEVEAPPGTPMAYVKPISQHSNENEMLLAAGTHYKIISVKKVGHQLFVRMRVVPPPSEGA